MFFQSRSLLPKRLPEDSELYDKSEVIIPIIPDEDDIDTRLSGDYKKLIDEAEAKNAARVEDAKYRRRQLFADISRSQLLKAHHAEAKKPTPNLRLKQLIDRRTAINTQISELKHAIQLLQKGIHRRKNLTRSIAGTVIVGIGGFLLGDYLQKLYNQYPQDKISSLQIIISSLKANIGNYEFQINEFVGQIADYEYTIQQWKEHITILLSQILGFQNNIQTFNNEIGGFLNQTQVYRDQITLVVGNELALANANIFLLGNISDWRTQISSLQFETIPSYINQSLAQLNQNISAVVGAVLPIFNSLAQTTYSWYCINNPFAPYGPTGQGQCTDRFSQDAYWDHGAQDGGACYRLWPWDGCAPAANSPDPCPVPINTFSGVFYNQTTAIGMSQTDSDYAFQQTNIINFGVMQFQASIQQLENSIAQAKARIVVNQQAILNAKSVIEYLQKDILNVPRQIEDLKHQINNTQREITETEISVNLSQNKIKTIQSEINQTNYSIVKRQASINQTKLEIDQVQSEIGEVADGHYDYDPDEFNYYDWINDAFNFYMMASVPMEIALIFILLTYATDWLNNCLASKRLRLFDLNEVEYTSVTLTANKFGIVLGDLSYRALISAFEAKIEQQLLSLQEPELGIRHFDFVSECRRVFLRGLENKETNMSRALNEAKIVEKIFTFAGITDEDPLRPDTKNFLTYGFNGIFHNPKQKEKLSETEVATMGKLTKHIMKKS